MNWLTSGVKWVSNLLGGSAVGAIASTAVQGAVAGMAVGAVSSLIRGEDILKGALKGAAYGGIAGGALSAVNQTLFSGSTTNAANNVLAGNMGSSTPSVGPGSAGGNPGLAAASGGSIPVQAINSPVPVQAGGGLLKWAKSDAGGKILGSAISGGSDMVGQYYKAEEEEKLQEQRIKMYKDLRQMQIDADRVEINEVGKAPITSAAILNRSNIKNNNQVNWWVQRTT